MKMRVGDSGVLIKIGDRVKLVTPNYTTVGRPNPYIGSEWECEGVVDKLDKNILGVGVMWENGEHNSYRASDLVLTHDENSIEPQDFT